MMASSGYVSHSALPQKVPNEVLQLTEPAGLHPGSAKNLSDLQLACRRMQALVAKEKEPITPFLAKIGALRKRGVSCILVMGGSGEYFGVSDAVVCMDNYSCRDVTAEAMAIDERFGASAAAQGSGAAYGSVTPRCPVSIYPGSPAGQPCCGLRTGVASSSCL